MDQHRWTRRTLLAAGVVVSAFPAGTTPATTAGRQPVGGPPTSAAVGGRAGPATGTDGGDGAQPPPDPRAALAALLDGNRRFSSGRARQPRQNLSTLRRLATGQRPMAVVLGCADSRVPPEVLFDQGLGDLFDNRLAGNVVDELVLGSIEYAVWAFGTPLVVVLGHERCGAVAATVDAIQRGSSPPHHIGAVVAALRPVVAPALALPGDPVENGCRANVRAQVRALRERSGLLAGRVDQNALLVVGARYDLDDGVVTLV